MPAKKPPMRVKRSKPACTTTISLNPAGNEPTDAEVADFHKRLEKASKGTQRKRPDADNPVDMLPQPAEAACEVEGPLVGDGLPDTDDEDLGGDE